MSTVWHEWFAWRPVLVGGRWTWLTRVMRREHLEYGEYRWTEYVQPTKEN